MKLIFLVAISALIFNVSFNATAGVAPQRILFVAPHPDDEILGTGAEIWKAQHTAGVDYRVVIMTCGDAYQHAFEIWTERKESRDINGDGKIDYIDLGIARHSESLAALALLGVPAHKVIFLGYPDGGLDKLPQDKGSKYLSSFTNTDKVPYSFAYRVGAPYTYQSPIEDLKNIILKFDPSLVYSTTPTDAHPDHAFTRTYVTEALKLAGGSRSHLEYLVHWEGHMTDWPGATQQWANPTGHVPPDIKVELSKLGMNRDTKASAIRLYKTQTNVEGDYLVNFAKESELFWNSRPKLSDYLLP